MSSRQLFSDRGRARAIDRSRITAVVLTLLCFSPWQGRAATGTIRDVLHVVIFTQENRSFDHYFGSLRGVQGFADGDALLLPTGRTDFYQPQGGGFVLPFHSSAPCEADLDHSWAGTHSAANLGKWDNWVPAKGASTMAYYTRADLPFYYALADAYTICDAYFCSALASTNPNRLFLMTGTIDPTGAHGGPIIDNSEPANGFTWTTYPERLQAAGVSWKVYQEADNFDDNPLAWFAQYKSAKPGNPLYDRGMATVTNLISAFQADVTQGKLPRVSWVVAPTTWSEHPPFAPASGAWLTKQLLDALASNPAIYNSTVFLLTYDENDGFFDHVPSPAPTPRTPDEFVGGLPIGLGARVPTLVISPWSRGGYVCSETFDHTSIIRFLETWTGVVEPNISAWRRSLCGDLTSAFNFAAPDPSYPNLSTAPPFDCQSVTSPAAPSPQTFPAQEPGVRPARPLPYQPNAWMTLDCANSLLILTMTNAGAASVHLSTHANLVRPDGPWHYDLGPGKSQITQLNLLPANGGKYDFTCYGPNGFQRRFAGNISAACGQLEVSAAIDASGGAVELNLENGGAAPVEFTVSDNYGAGATATETVPARGASAFRISVAANQNAAYDVGVTTPADGSFLRGFAGHVEPRPPALAAVRDAATLTLQYPNWSGAYALEASADLTSNSWNVVTVPATISGATATVTLPLPTNTVFFRLRR